jgi:hypothetical protein
MELLSLNTYKHKGEIIALAPGTYDPEDEASVISKLDEVLAEIATQLAAAGG